MLVLDAVVPGTAEALIHAPLLHDRVQGPGLVSRP
ncbi:hypothetical protein SAMN02745866_04050 [Alteromonadaceae bacterium Bs31]|nr:hypothetical protein SAMN02745866_04050 [Alteromonadaceae bacterium Bs31]